MSREQAFIRMLDAAAKIQLNVAVMLEAKAIEAEKIYQWIYHHVHHHTLETHEERVKTPIKYHENILEVLEGLTKMEYALAKNLKIVLNKEEETSFGFGGSSDFSNLFDSNGDD